MWYYGNLFEEYTVQSVTACTFNVVHTRTYHFYKKPYFGDEVEVVFIQPRQGFEVKFYPRRSDIADARLFRELNHGPNIDVAPEVNIPGCSLRGRDNAFYALRRCDVEGRLVWDW